MKKYSKIVFIALTAVWLTSCNQGHEEKDKKAIKEVVKAYEEAYNQKNAEKLSSFWLKDGYFNNPVTGDSAEGREEIAELFKKKFSQDDRHLEITVQSIDFPNQNEAIEKGLMKVTVNNDPPLHVAYQTEYLKENGKWLLSSISQIELVDTTSHFEELKDLAWLVGKWEDYDDDIEILFDNQWDKYKNFITQHFQMKIYGQESVEGKQIIAWDPIKKIVRSWVFDSEGGFGEGTWEKVNTSWYASLNYTLGDGSVASATQVYTPVDDNSYKFASIEREIDGEILPDIDAVTVEKVK